MMHDLFSFFLSFFLFLVTEGEEEQGIEKGGWSRMMGMGKTNVHASLPLPCFRGGRSTMRCDRDLLNFTIFHRFLSQTRTIFPGFDGSAG
jgi:hypothetical protein